jgi:hypothetical protein
MSDSIARFFTVSNARHLTVNYLLPILIGAAAGFLILGWQPLSLENIAWLQKDDDSAQHYVGWLFYRHSPWTFPIGSNPNFGMEIGSSIVFSDSIPLFAVFFKLFSGFLPDTFQYLGLWLLFSFMLQAIFAWKLVGLITDDTTIKSCATGLFVIAPAFLYRACFTGAEALSAHWLILAGLYLCLTKNPEPKKWKWLALTVVASLVHAYLLAMVLLLWLADSLRRLLVRQIGPAALFKEYCIVITGMLLSLWQAGYFIPKTGLGGPGFGSCKMNLLALINPYVFYPPLSHVVPETWSYLLPSLPATIVFEYEGFNYLGLGIILLFAGLLPRIVHRLNRSEFDLTWLPLFVSCVLLTFFAITHCVSIGSVNLVFGIPDKVEALASIFRCSGRMFWPVYYLIIWFLLFMLVRSYRKKTVTAVLLAVLALQLADTSAGWGPKKLDNSMVGKTWTEPFKSPFWETAALHYKKIRVIPAGASPINKEVSYFAARHRMATDSAYLARYDTEKLKKLDAYDVDLLNTGNYQADTLYFVGPSNGDLAKKHLKAGQDVFAVVDGYSIIAPGWKFGAIQ